MAIPPGAGACQTGGMRQGLLSLVLGVAVVWGVDARAAASAPALPASPTPQSSVDVKPPQDSLPQRLSACTACHGIDGRAGPDGYYPRLAGKPQGYLYNQLLNFREGRRRYGPMVWLVDHLSDDYLQEIAGYFSGLHHPYPPPMAPASDAAVLARGQALVFKGDAALRLPACVQCHGQALTGVLPAIPGLLGLPRDYLAAQLGAWASGNRQGHKPDCMADVAKALAPEDVGAVTAWLASQPWPLDGRPAAKLPSPLPKPCGGVGTPGGAP